VSSGVLWGIVSSAMPGGALHGLDPSDKDYLNE